MQRRPIPLLFALAVLSACKGDPVAAGAADGDPVDEVGSSDGGALGDGDARPSEDTSSTVTDASVPDTFAAETFSADTPDTPDTPDTRDAAAPPIGDGGGGCPTGRGPDMAAIPTKKYCIDTTEVTEAQFNVFLADGAPKPTAPTIPAFCEGRPLPAAASDTSYPRVHVEWCHAYSFCKWAGKRLCGRHTQLGGGENPESNGFAPSTSQWSYACRGGDPGTRYPYGPSYVKGVCAGDDGLTGTVSLAETKYDGCHPPTAPFTSLRHMSGNVLEWEDSCNGAIGAGITCRTRGGGFYSDQDQLACDEVATWEITNENEAVGFRCCADLP